MEHLLEAWPRLETKVRNALHVLALADFDGTLTPIVARPEMAVLPEETRRVLEGLARSERCTVGIISGRAIEDLKNKIGIPGIIYSGNHGLEIEAPQICFDNPVAREVSPEMRSIYQQLAATLEKIEGVRVENKGLSLCVHYREVEKRRVKDLESAFQHFGQLIHKSEKLKVTPGKKTYDIRPAGWDKGTIVELLLRSYQSGGGLLAMYLGDDVTDEDAFRAIPEDGITVFIGRAKRRTAASYYLHSPGEVTVFLGKLLKAEQGRG